MTNCPNCGAPLNPYSWRCEYCGTYIFDLDAWDITDGKPTFVKFKTPQGTITTLATPRIATVEVNTEYTSISDGLHRPITILPRSSNCDINVKFSCMANPKNRILYEVEE